MQISNNINQQHFGATKIGTVKIKHLKNGKWVDESASLIKFNKSTDINVLREIQYSWRGKNCSDAILKDAELMPKNTDVYGVTWQKSDFGITDPEKVVGISSAEEAYEVLIFRQGTIPEFAYDNPNRTVKGIGEALVRGLQKHATKKNGFDTPFFPFCSTSETEARKFYNRIG